MEDQSRAAGNIPRGSSLLKQYVVVRARVGLALMSVQLGDVSASEERYTALESRRGTLVARSLATDRLLGLLSHTMGKLDQAVAHFEDAVSYCR